MSLSISTLIYTLTAYKINVIINYPIKDLLFFFEANLKAPLIVIHNTYVSY